MLEEKKRSLKKKKINFKESQCSSPSISPSCSTGPHSALSRSPSPRRKSSFSKAKNESFKHNYKYIFNSRTPSPVQNMKSFTSNSNLNNTTTTNTPTHTNNNNKNNIGCNNNQFAIKSNELKSPVTCPPPVRKQLPPIPVRTITSRDDYELKKLINQSMNQLIINNPRFYHQAFTITNNPNANNNNKTNDSDENEEFF